MAKDEAWKAHVEEYDKDRFDSTSRHRRHCFDAGWEAALADTLGMLEEIARQEWAATLETGDEEHFKVRVQQNPDRTAGGFRYWIAEPGERLGEETTRAEVLVLLAGKEKE